MRIQTVAGVRTCSGEPPRSTAYYYADLERLKRKNAPIDPKTDPIGLSDPEEVQQNPNELSEYVETNEVVNDGAVREVPPLRDRQWSLPEYHTPENIRKVATSLPEYNTPENSRKVAEETYSTAGTFPMPEPKEKEPLLAELEVVGRLPLTQLESSPGVRRSRSWYLCCPNVPDEEISRESSWRYSSLRPVTAPPLPGQNGLHMMVGTQSSGRGAGEVGEDLRSERDALARALAAERQRAAVAARAHDARLAELHGVIAELVRRRAADHRAPIPEEEASDECESTTQPAGDADADADADRSRTEQNDTSSMLSPAELPTPREARELPDDTTDTSTHEIELRVTETHADALVTAGAHAHPEPDACDACHSLSERDSELCLTTARCCQFARHAHSHAHTLATSGSAGGSCEREHGSSEGARVFTSSPGRCESRQAKVASRVRLRRYEDCDSNQHQHQHHTEESGDGAGVGAGWCGEAAERLALEVCAHADLREALAAANNDGSLLSASVGVWRARCARLEADCRVLQCALARAVDTAQRLSCACAVAESSSVSLCCALRAADRALETYDVLLALAETQPGASTERCAAESVARQLLARLDGDHSSATIGEPLLSPGPWLQHDHQEWSAPAWSAQCEARLRRHAARLKGDTVTLRTLQPPPHLFSYHDIEKEELPKSVGSASMAEMEAAVTMQEVLAAREARAAARAAEVSAGAPGAPPAPAAPTAPAHDHDHADTAEFKSESTRSRRRRERHWLDAPASETDL